MTDEDIDPRDEALLRIGAELSAIRGELTTIRQALVDPDTGSNDDADGTAVTCRCGATFPTTDAGAAHAREVHDAPRGTEGDILTDT
jgi:hypothetical protein